MSSLKKVIPGQSLTTKNANKFPLLPIFLRDPFARGTLNLNDSGRSIRNIDGSNNNLAQQSLGATKEPFIRLSEVEFEDGIQSPAGIALDASGKPLPGIDGNPVKRQPIPIFTEAEKNRLTERGLEVVQNTNKLSNEPDSPFVLLNPSDRTSPRVISNTLSNLKLGESLPNRGGLNALNWSFGQFVNHDGNLGAESAKDEENPNRIGSFNLPIDIPANDPNFPPNIPPTPTISRQEDGGLQFNFPRGAFAKDTGVALDNGKPVPGQVRNKATHWLDLSVVYGSTNELAKELRSFKSGKLKVFSDATPTLKDDLLPTDDKKLMRGGAFQGVGFLAGDERVSENDALAVQHTLWMRNHNRLAQGLSKLHPKWTDEQVFQRARQINIAQYQNIVMYEWLPLQVGGKVDKYKGYDQKETGNISTEFNAAAFRYGHTQTNNRIQSIDANGNLKTIPLLTSFGAPSIKTGSDVDNILRGDSKLLAEKIDTNVVFDLRNALFPPAGVGFDLFSANIQRGRDRGLADYNEVRTSVGLPRVKSFAEITSDSQKAEKLQQLYGTVEDIDLLVGLFSEDPVAPSGAGITTRKIVMEQFERLRDADRFWFERPVNKGGFFTQQEIKAIKDTSFDDIIKLNSDVKDIGKNAFLVASSKNPIDNSSPNLDSLLDKLPNKGDRNFANSVKDVLRNTVDPLTGKPLTVLEVEEYAKELTNVDLTKFNPEDKLANANINVNSPLNMAQNNQPETLLSLGAANNRASDIFTQANNTNPFDNLLASNSDTRNSNFANSTS